MDNEVITLQDAIKQVDKWLAIADHGCRTWGGREAPLTGMEQRYYDMYVSKWGALKEVALLLSKVVEADDEYRKHDTE